MPRLTIPEPEITLYEEGFDGKDLLDRKETGKRLSELVENIDDPITIALDGAWGSGKSFFLKCWVGEHYQSEEYSAQPVYFDAFEHDFLDDPLIALTGVIAERFQDLGEKPSAMSKAKQAASKLWRPGLRIGLALATAGTSELAGAVVDAGLVAGSEELEKAATEFWKKEDGKRAAMQAFKDALVELTEPAEDGAPTQKLIIVVDELDRCRPDYALSLLEIIKHFFAVPGVHFVLGVNLRELENSVRARYGAQSDASRYLSKFLTAAMSLPDVLKSSSQHSLKQYSQELVHQHNVGKASPLLYLDLYLSSQELRSTLTLRDLQRIAAQSALLTPFDTNWGGKYSNWLLCGLIILKTCNPSAFAKLRAGNMNQPELLDFFGLPHLSSRSNRHQNVNRSTRLAELWNFFVNPRFMPGSQADIDEDLEDYRPDGISAVSRNEVIPEIIRSKLSWIEGYNWTSG